MPTRGTLPELPPLCSAADSSADPATAQRTPVLFLHGVLASPGNFEGAIRSLVATGTPVMAPAYGNRGTGDIDRSLAELNALLQSQVPDTVPRIDIVGHSLGALLGLRLAHLNPGRVRTLVGIGAAWHGVPFAPGRRGRLLRAALGIVGGRAYRQLLLEEPLSAEIPSGTRVVSVVSDADRIVPPHAARLGEVHSLTGVAHEHLPQQTEAILTALDWRP